MKRLINKGFIFALILAALLPPGQVFAQSYKENPELDNKVRQFLSDHARQWHDMNVPTLDAQKLHELILKENYKSALEIGTSTG